MRRAAVAPSASVPLSPAAEAQDAPRRKQLESSLLSAGVSDSAVLAVDDIRIKLEKEADEIGDRMGEEGIDEDAVETALDDDDDPKGALVTLLLNASKADSRGGMVVEHKQEQKSNSFVVASAATAGCKL